MKKENDVIVWTDSVKRFYDGGGHALLSRLIIPDKLLLDSGYVYFNLEGAGNLTDLKITYSFSRGQAAQGYGSVVGENGKDYIHSYKGCGVTACFELMYKNDDKVFERKN